MQIDSPLHFQYSKHIEGTIMTNTLFYIYTIVILYRSNRRFIQIKS